MWAFGRYDLGLGEEEFWHLTPRQWGALIERWEEAQEWKDYRVGIIASTIVNTTPRKKGSKLYKPEDFMPTKGRKGKQTVEEQLAIAKAITAGFGDG